ncbi:hypothetical protein F6X40_35675 [Paraburkholderia sp. UCT31]|uniref:hypothetical protein n=1 Tax=Paraburkholderia sp. UCT31 TaxID=2615209 RepID=UPI001654D147|nr:hypothetical protein [Paraburkholderia sp. UCT31]MBC8741891.1 hypothetical protein [Paraburkholderia sp. UCT31]
MILDKSELHSLLGAAAASTKPRDKEAPKSPPAQAATALSTTGETPSEPHAASRTTAPSSPPARKNVRAADSTSPINVIPKSADNRPDPRYTDAHRELAYALPKLWAHAKKEAEKNSEARTATRQKLRTLIAWLAQKKGWQALERAPMKYARNGETIDGRLDVAIFGSQTTALLGVEIDWGLEVGSLLKLRAAHESKYPVMWVCGTPAQDRESAREARKFAIKELGRESGEWLLIYHLDYGWV